MAETPEIEGDLLALYGVSVRRFFADGGTSRELTLLIERLPLEPRSRFRAKHLLGGEEWFGWDIEASRVSDLVDLLDLNTRASAQQKAKMRTIAPRPEMPSKNPDAPKTDDRPARVADMRWGDALRNLGV